MRKIGYKIKMGNITVTDKSQTTEMQLISLISELAMDGIGGQAVLEFADSKTSRLEKEAKIEVYLDAGDGPVQVFTGEVFEVSASPTSLRITAFDGLAKLARREVEATYEKVTSDFIVKDIFQQAKLETGQVEKGPEFPSYFLHKGTAAIHHVRRLAKLCGMDLYTDGRGKVNFVLPRQGTPDHQFSYGEDVLIFDLKQIHPFYDSITLWGEGAASQRGSEKSHWLATDLSGVKGASHVSSDGSVSSGDSGKRPLFVTDGTIRSGEAAQELATAQMRAIVSRKTQGFLQVLGKPGIDPGDLVGIRKLPDDHAASKLYSSEHPLRVRRVQHTLNIKRGFVTRMNF